MIFYVCSYGGCGSTMLNNELSKYGHSYHLHDRNPPIKFKKYDDSENIQIIKNRKTKREIIRKRLVNEHLIINPIQFKFGNIIVPDDQLNNYKVIYIYKNPINAIYSRFLNKRHLFHLDINENITLEDVVEQKKDLYNIEEFFDNYTTPNPERNYKIYAIKYEEIFNHQEELSKILGVGPFNMIKKETKREMPYKEVLEEIYENLIMKMNAMNWIEII